MDLPAFWHQLHEWPLAAAMRGDTPGTEWLFPIVETLHVTALTLFFGSIALVDLRLLGLAQREAGVSDVARDTLPLTWAAWCVAALMGALMFVSKADSYAANTLFRLKFLCMVFAALNMLVFQFGAYRQVGRWEHGEPPAAARWAGALSLALWTAVVCFGRWTGFTT